MEAPSHHSDRWLRLILVAATLAACAAQISACMSLIGELSCEASARPALTEGTTTASKGAPASCGLQR